MMDCESTANDDQDNLLCYGDRRYTYTEHGETLSETSPSGTTTYDYDVFSNLRSVDLADGTTVAYAIDPSDRRIADSSGRLSKLVFPAETRDYGYDPGTGQLTGITSTSGEGLAFEYDGDLVTKTTWSGTINASVEKEYDPNFWVVRETINGAHAVDYVYDDDGLLVQAGAMTIQRDPVTGFVTGTTFDNITTQTTYNAYGERETHTAWFQTTMLYYEAHERDDLGRITKTTEIVEGVQKVWEYAYDLDGRLAEAYVDGDLRYSYTYDPNGNRTRFEDPIAGVVITADYDDQDRLLRYGDTTYTYTEHGETLSETSPSGTTTYDYDVFSNLRSVDLADGTTVDYAIDPSDRRIATFTDGAYTDGFVYRDDLEEIARLDASGAVDQRYVYGTFEQVPDYFDGLTGRFAYVTDIRGSVRLVIDSTTGVVVDRVAYSPFGAPDEVPTSFGFVGALSGHKPGTWRFGARDLDATTGAWRSKDSIRFEGRDTNLHGYAFNDPINNIDIDGEIGFAVAVSVAAGVGIRVGAAIGVRTLLTEAALACGVVAVATISGHDIEEDDCEREWLEAEEWCAEALGGPNPPRGLPDDIEPSGTVHAGWCRSDVGEIPSINEDL